jgi:integrase
MPEIIDTLHGVIHVRASAAQVRGQGRVVGRPKSAAGARTVAIPPHLVPELEAHAAHFPAPGTTGWFFAGPKGGPLQSANFGAKVWRPALTSLGLTGTHFHDTRATSATLTAVHGDHPRTDAPPWALHAQHGHALPARQR